MTFPNHQIKTLTNWWADNIHPLQGNDPLHKTARKRFCAALTEALSQTAPSSTVHGKPYHALTSSHTPSPQLSHALASAGILFLPFNALPPDRETYAHSNGDILIIHTPKTNTPTGHPPNKTIVSQLEYDAGATSGWINLHHLSLNDTKPPAPHFREETRYALFPISEGEVVPLLNGNHKWTFETAQEDDHYLFVTQGTLPVDEFNKLSLRSLSRLTAYPAASFGTVNFCATPLHPPLDGAAEQLSPIHYRLLSPPFQVVTALATFSTGYGRTHTLIQEGDMITKTRHGTTSVIPRAMLANGLHRWTPCTPQGKETPSTAEHDNIFAGNLIHMRVLHEHSANRLPTPS